MFYYHSSVPTAERDDYPRIGYEHIKRNEFLNILPTNGVDDSDPYRVAIPSMGEYWEADADGQTAVLDFVFESRSVDYVAIAMPKKLNQVLTNQTASGDGNLYIQYHDGSTYVGFVIDSDNVRHVGNVFIFHFDAVTTTAIRISWNAYSDDANENLKVSNVYIGSITKLPRKVFVGYAPANLNKKSAIVGGKSEISRFHGRIKKTVKSGGSISIENVDPVTYRDEIEPFAKQARELPFFMAWRPASQNLETDFCWLGSDVSAPNQSPNGMMSFDFNFNAFCQVG